MNGLELRSSPLNQEDLVDLQIQMQQTSTESLQAERASLRKLLQGKLLGRIEPGSGTHPTLARLQLVERELTRRAGSWPNPEPQRVINRADVPINGPMRYAMSSRSVPPAPTSQYVEAKAMSDAERAEFVAEISRSSADELEDLANQLELLVANITAAGLVRTTPGLHPDAEKLQIVEAEIETRSDRSWLCHTALRGAAVGALVGGGAGYISGRSTTRTAALGAVVSAVAAAVSPRYRKLIGAVTEAPSVTKAEEMATAAAAKALDEVDSLIEGE